MTTKDLFITDRDEVRKKWNKSREDVQKDIKIIKDWIKTQQHLPEVPNDNMIEFILTNCKFSIEKTKKNVDMYYTIRTLMPNVFEKGNPQLPENQAIFDSICQVALPKLTDSLHRIIVLKFKEDKKGLFDPYKMLLYGANFSEIRMHEDLVMGDIFLIDCEYFKMNHIIKFTPTFLKASLFAMENVWSHRLKEIHLINYPPYMDKMMTVAKGILKKKLYDRIYLHPNLENVYKVFPKELLPSDYGGDGKSLEEMAALWKLKFEEYENRFNLLDKLRVQENLRPVPLENDEVLGYYGNFKKLDVD